MSCCWAMRWQHSPVVCSSLFVALFVLLAAPGLAVQRIDAAPGEQPPPNWRLGEDQAAEQDPISQAGLTNTSALGVSAVQSCDEYEDNQGVQHFDCSTAMRNRSQAPFYFTVNTEQEEVLGVFVNLTVRNFSTDLAKADGSLDSAGPILQVPDSATVQLMAGFGSTWTPFLGPSGATSLKSSPWLSASVMCFPQYTGTQEFILEVLAIEPVGVGLQGAVSKAGTSKTMELTYGGTYGASAMHALHINDDKPRVERFIFKTKKKGVSASSLPTSYAYIFPETSDCIASEVTAGGCANPESLVNCFQKATLDFEASSKTVAHHFSFRETATFTLSASSFPALSSGRWFVLVTCEDMTDPDECEETTVTITQESESGVWLTLLAGAALYVIIPVFCFVAVDIFHSFWQQGLRYLARAPVMDPGDWVFFAFPDRAFLEYLRQRSYDVTTPKFAALLLLVAAVYAVMAGQLVITHFSFMVRTGNRDVCYYNEKCYYPGFGIDAAANSLLSHAAYLAAGLHVFYQVLYASYRCSKEEGVAAPDLTAFLALGGAIMCEGMGSMFYHLCPSMETFQFDTAFMLPLAHLSMLALHDADTEPAQRDDGSQQGASSTKDRDDRHMYPMQYFLFVLCPIWAFDFIGTWYDVDWAKHRGLYLALLFAVTIWTYCMLGVVARFFPSEGCGKVGQIFLQSILAFSMAVALLAPEIRKAIGGMPTVFLFLSIIVMVVVVLYQMVRDDIQLQYFEREHWLADSVRWLLGHALFFTTLAASFFALGLFRQKVADSGPDSTPATSREFAQSCSFAGMYDAHDLWHLASAVALALWVMLLLDMRLRRFQNTLASKKEESPAGDSPGAGPAEAFLRFTGFS